MCYWAGLKYIIVIELETCSIESFAMFTGQFSNIFCRDFLIVRYISQINLGNVWVRHAQVISSTYRYIRQNNFVYKLWVYDLCSLSLFVVSFGSYEVNIWTSWIVHQFSAGDTCPPLLETIFHCWWRQFPFDKMFNHMLLWLQYALNVVLVINGSMILMVGSPLAW